MWYEFVIKPQNDSRKYFKEQAAKSVYAKNDATTNGPTSIKDII